MDYEEYDYGKSNKRVSLKDDAFVLATRRNRNIKIPLAIVKTVASMEANLDELATAIWFYRTTKNVEDYKWVKIIELENVDLTGWKLWHYKEDYDFSDWECITLPHFLKRDKSGCLVLEEILNTEYSTDFPDEDEDVLLVKPTARVYSQEVAMTIDLENKYREELKKKLT